MAIVQRSVIIVHRQGLHARPAALFVQRAKRFASRVKVKKGRKVVDGKSIMGLLTLAAQPGSRIVVVAEGTDAAEAVEQLCAIVTQPLSESSTETSMESSR